MIWEETLHKTMETVEGNSFECGGGGGAWNGTDFMSS